MDENNNKVFNWIKNNWKDCLLFVFIFMIIILIMSTTCVNRQNKNLKNNIKALTDSVQVIKLKNNELLYEKQSLIINKSELEKYLDISKKEYKELEKELESSLAMIAKLKGVVKIDTLRMIDSIYISNDTIQTIFKYNDKWLVIDGTTIFYDSIANTTFNNITMEAPLKLGFTDDYKVFVKTDNPYLSFPTIDAAIIEGSVTNKKKNHWNIGIQAGFGCQYGLIHKTFDVGPYIGIGISYGWNF